MKLLALASLAATAVAVPMTSAYEANVLTARSVPDICSAKSDCVPFSIEVTWGSANPIGAGGRNVILTNGAFPGPALRLKVGECVDFKVVNKLSVRTGIHFHGIEQRGTPWSDGTPGLSQSAIEPGATYMYRWEANEVGAFFYHAHYKGQIMDGLYGAIHISPADNQQTPFSLIDSANAKDLAKADSMAEPFFASDWTQFTFDELYNIEQRANIDIACADSIIINGMGSGYCLTRAQITAMQAPVIPRLLNRTSGLTDKACIPPNTTATQGVRPNSQNIAAVPLGLYEVCTPSVGKNYTYKVDPANKYAAITFYNTGGFSLLKATIDNHKMWVYGWNGQYIQPQRVDQVAIGNGDRVSVFIKLDQAVGDYQIRVANNGLNQILSGFGVLSYKGSNGPSATAISSMTYNGGNTTAIVPFNGLAAAPFPAIPVSSTADRSIMLSLRRDPAAGNAWQWNAAGNTSYLHENDDNMPLLYQNPATIAESATVYKTRMGQWIDLIMVTAGPIAQPHPMHKHANKFFVIGQGQGSFNWSSVAQAQAAGIRFNLVNPPYVDGYTTPPGQQTDTWVVLRYKVEVPGAWFMHCHMQTHFSGGMAIVLMDGVDAWPRVPADVGKVCQGKGNSKSDWNPSCSCPAACPANKDNGVKQQAYDGMNDNNSYNNNNNNNNANANANNYNNNEENKNNNANAGNNVGNAASSGSGNANMNAAPSQGDNRVAAQSSGNNNVGQPAPTSSSSTPTGSQTVSSPIRAFTGAASTTSTSLFTIMAVALFALSL